MTLELVAAFVAGAGSIIGGAWSLRRARREEQARCEQRLSDIREAYNKGMDKGMHVTERRDS